MYLKTYLSNTPNTLDQIQIQIHSLKFDKYKYVFDPSPGAEYYFEDLVMYSPFG